MVGIRNYMKDEFLLECKGITTAVRWTKRDTFYTLNFIRGK